MGNKGNLGRINTNFGVQKKMKSGKNIFINLKMVSVIHGWHNQIYKITAAPLLIYRGGKENSSIYWYFANLQKKAEILIKDLASFGFSNLGCKLRYHASRKFINSKCNLNLFWILKGAVVGRNAELTNSGKELGQQLL